VEFRLDPWSSQLVVEYDKLFKYFGIRPFKEVLPELERIVKPHHLMRRGVIFGHRDFERVLQALRSGEGFAILTGLMPSGHMHFGHKMVIDQVIYYQGLGAEIFIAIADVEAYAVRRLSRRDVIRYAKEYVANYLALGLRRERLHIYFQSNYRVEYYRLMQLLSRRVTSAELKDIYGDVEPGKVMSIFAQMADILHPQLPSFGSHRVVLVPVGADQDPHLRLARDLADRYSAEFKSLGLGGLERPASTYHRFMSGLTGGKMSSSKPESYIALTDDPDVAAAKLMRALTGGRPTAAEQRRLGGEPEKCPVYEMLSYHLVPDDEELKRIYLRCRGGEMLCGECKREAAERLRRFLQEHQRRLERARDIVDSVVDVPDF